MRLYSREISTLAFLLDNVCIAHLWRTVALQWHVKCDILWLFSVVLYCGRIVTSWTGPTSPMTYYYTGVTCSTTKCSTQLTYSTLVIYCRTLGLRVTLLWFTIQYSTAWLLWHTCIMQLPIYCTFCSNPPTYWCTPRALVTYLSIAAAPLSTRVRYAYHPYHAAVWLCPWGTTPEIYTLKTYRCDTFCKK